MTLGPLEYTVMGFEGNDFNGNIADGVPSGSWVRTTALVDATVITKDGNGDVTVIELDNTADRRFAGPAP